MTKLIPLILLFALGCLPQKNNTAPEFTKLPLKRLTESPRLSGDMPRSVKISPDGTKLSFLKGKKDNFSVMDLWLFDLNSGEPKLLVDSSVLTKGENVEMSNEEAAMRERKRIMETGIVEYQWSKQGDQILFPINGDLYLYKLGAKAPVSRLTNTKEYETEPHFSPLGNFISFIRDYNVFILNLKTKAELQVTFAGTKDNPMGSAEFMAQEEMSRYRGYFWSPNEEYLAVNKVDNSSIVETERFEIYTDKVSVIKQRYPYAGTENAKVQINIFKTLSAGKKQKPTTINISAKDHYIPQIKWLPKTKESILSYTVQNRDQTTLDFMTFNITTKKYKKVFVEKDTAWVNIRHDYKFLKETNHLLWISEQSGYSHVHLIDLSSGKNKQITSGKWNVTSLLAVDEKNKTFYFTSTKDSPLERHLYKALYDGEEALQKISKDSGYHSTVITNNPSFYIDYHSSPDKPLSLALHNLDGSRKFFIKENKIDGTHPLYKYKDGFSKWEYGEFKRSEKPSLYYKMLKPKSFDPSKKYPVVQYVYGGPGVQLVKKTWGSNFYQQVLAQNGFIVLVADNRGTPNRGRDFERAYHMKFGDIEVIDQSEVLKHVLNKHSFIDEKRVGVYGHSYGGYLTLMLMMQKPDLYHVGVSGAPVVDWALYDTHYTERYIEKPQSHPEIYKKSNVLTYAGNLKGHLLVAHGMADDNVLYKNSLILYSALQEKGVLFDVMPYPGAKHGIRRKKSWKHHYMKTSLNYFKKNL